MMTAIIMAFLCVNLNAQSIESLFEKYSKKENSTHIHINKNIIKLFSSDEDDLKGFEDIKGIEIVVLEDNNNMDISEYKQLLSLVQKQKMEELVKIRSKGSYVDFMFTEEGLYLKDLIMLARSDEGTFLLRLDGRILREKLDDIDIDFQGMNHLKKLGRV